ncbi:hypothetical protein BJ322DRAFT_1193734 [Thelephora terrestris]|uniref:Transmembrane protein n=1 Tax=Thelephora terrestris TaxID=56493 RepID=A0A9P6HEP2_9AGAM|nr:hypothetical protein BJ322DRAFT_1193734 [Thelephora terrestris]
MSQEPVEVTPPSILDQEQPLLHDDETDSLAYTSESTIVLPKPSKGFLQHQRKFRQRVRRWISRRSVKMFIALIIVAVLSFCPALVSNSSPADKTDHSAITKAPLNVTTDGMYMDGIIFDFDWSGTRTLSVLWNAYRVPFYPSVEVPFNDTHWWNAAYIYIDKWAKSLLTSISERYSTKGCGSASNPVFHYAPSNVTLATSDGSEQNGAYVPPFETKLDLRFSNQYYFPEDECIFAAIIFVLDEATNSSVPISDLSLVSSGPGDFDTENNGNGPGISLKIVHDAGGGPTAEWVQATYLTVEIKHSQRARAITYSMFTINWILTLSSMITTSVMFNRRGEGKDMVALLPITVILTIPVIRSLYVGSPPYGIFLDVVGFFPQMLTVVACTVVVLSGIAMQSIRSESAPPGKEDVQC